MKINQQNIMTTFDLCQEEARGGVCWRIGGLCERIILLQAIGKFSLLEVPYYTDLSLCSSWEGISRAKVYRAGVHSLDIAPASKELAC